MKGELGGVSGEFLPRELAPDSVHNCREFEADIGDHARHMGGAHPGVGNAGGRRILEAHGETHAQDESGTAAKCRHQQIACAQRQEQDALDDDAHGVDRANPSPAPRIDHHARRKRAGDEGDHDEREHAGECKIACHKIFGQERHVAGHVG